MKRTIFLGFLTFFLFAGMANAQQNGHAHVGLDAEMDGSSTTILDATTTSNNDATATVHMSATGSAMSGRLRGEQGAEMSAEHRSATGTEHAKGNVNGSTTATGTESVHASSTGMITSALHRSHVATVVANLKALATDHRGIGKQVSAVAKAQDKSNDRTSDAMAKVESRGGFMTFLIGSDYKNLGVIRSELATTNNSIDRLTKAKESALDAEAKVDLQAQIDTLAQTHADTKAFVNAHEDAVSLFGWFVKLFG